MVKKRQNSVKGDDIFVRLISPPLKMFFGFQIVIMNYSVQIKNKLKTWRLQQCNFYASTMKNTPEITEKLILFYINLINLIIIYYGFS